MLRRSLILFFAFLTPLSAYSVLSHEAIIDAAWDPAIKPLLLARFPNATEDDLYKAHAYAYGGAIIQDAGYYPFGSHFFSDLVHYVRSGGFVSNLLANAADLNETAFALGALAHHTADNAGHPMAINAAVPMLYPKLRHRFGKSVAYDQDPVAHLRVEFGFDVSQVAKNHYAPEAYHDFIGFAVAKPLLERTFAQTFDIELKDLMFSVDLALGTYRHAVNDVLPVITRAAWNMKKKELQRTEPSLTRRRFVYNLSRSSYEKEWGKQYEHPGIGARIVSFVLRLIPKVGWFKVVSFRAPTPEAEKLFMESFNQTLSRYRTLLADVRQGRPLHLTDENLDLGKISAAGAYPLADKTYARLLERLAKKQFDGVDPHLRSTILAYYTHQPPTDPKIAQYLHQLGATSNVADSR